VEAKNEGNLRQRAQRVTPLVYHAATKAEVEHGRERTKGGINSGGAESENREKWEKGEGYTAK